MELQLDERYSVQSKRCQIIDFEMELQHNHMSKYAEDRCQIIDFEMELQHRKPLCDFFLDVR